MATVAPAIMKAQCGHMGKTWDRDSANHIGLLIGKETFSREIHIQQMCTSFIVQSWTTCICKWCWKSGRESNCDICIRSITIECSDVSTSAPKITEVLLIKEFCFLFFFFLIFLGNIVFNTCLISGATMFFTGKHTNIPEFESVSSLYEWCDLEQIIKNTVLQKLKKLEESFQDSPLNTLTYPHSFPTNSFLLSDNIHGLFILLSKSICSYLLALLTCSKISLQQSSPTFSCTINFLLCWFFLISIQIFFHLLHSCTSISRHYKIHSYQYKILQPCLKEACNNCKNDTQI